MIFGIHHHQAPVHPKVARRKGGESRNSYIIWEEQAISALLTLEIVSRVSGEA